MDLPDRLAASPIEQSAMPFVAATRETIVPHKLAAAHLSVLQRSSQSGAALLPIEAAASLADIPLDLGRIEQTLSATVAEIKQLSPDLTGWLSLRHVNPLTVAVTAAAIGGGSAYYYLRRRNARDSNRQHDEESSSWIFSRLHSAASQ
ncbi:MAG TPA: hypothetical protein VKB78_05830, partial [Pirellulales bacterium]|nr:hypothetical protein [Pirellulales bacterium]